jgi:hypothetical protein
LDPETKRSLQAVIFCLMYVILFLILLPPLIRRLDDWVGKTLYTVLSVGAIALALRLRYLSKKW